MTELSQHWVCRICVAKYGLKGRDLAKWPPVGDEAGIERHLWHEHQIKVRHPNETVEECNRRYEVSPP
jgi:hypothetical protein